MAITSNREFISARLARFNVTTSDVDLILLESSLEGTAAVDLRACKLAIYKSLSAILPVANVSESQYSTTWNWEAIKAYYNALCRELGKPNALKPGIRDRSNSW